MICSHVDISSAQVVARGCTSALDDLFNGAFDVVPVLGVERGHLEVEVVLDLIQVPMLSGARDQADGDTDAPKTSGTADTMEISLWIRMAVVVIWQVLLTLARATISTTDDFRLT